MGTVLIADDIVRNARLLESLLAPDGHTVCTAGDGAEASRLVRSERPDIVLMDVMMPRVDGPSSGSESRQHACSRTNDFPGSVRVA